MIEKSCAGSYRFSFNGMEKNPEWGTIDFGARNYDPRIGRFLSIDPFTKSFPSMSGYSYALNTPIQAIDKDGNYPIFPNIESASRVANDVNALMIERFGKKYAPQVKLVAETEVRWVLEYNSSSNPKPIEGGGYSMVQKRVKTGRYMVRADLKTPWGARSKMKSIGHFVKALFDQLESTRKIDVTFNSGEERAGKYNLENAKGYTDSDTRIRLWDKLKTGSELTTVELDEPEVYEMGPDEDDIIIKEKEETRANTWTVGGTFLHEMTQHTHPKSSKYSAWKSQGLFNVPKSGIDHPNGVPIRDYSPEERKRLDDRIEKTGKKYAP
ncbi:MAG: hypothetical protein GY810_10530 [Aureispira sp.]|nr:hypothetical protein [Aureispira sp.]